MPNLQSIDPSISMMPALLGKQVQWDRACSLLSRVVVVIGGDLGLDFLKVLFGKWVCRSGIQSISGQFWVLGMGCRNSEMVDKEPERLCFQFPQSLLGHSAQVSPAPTSAVRPSPYFETQSQWGYQVSYFWQGIKGHPALGSWFRKCSYGIRVSLGCYVFTLSAPGILNDSMPPSANKNKSLLCLFWAMETLFKITEIRVYGIWLHYRSIYT